MAPTPERQPALTKAPTGEHPFSPAMASESRTVKAVPTPPPGGTVMLSGRVPAALRDRLKLHAVQSHQSVQEVLLKAVEDYLARLPL